MSFPTFVWITLGCVSLVLGRSLWPTPLSGALLTGSGIFLSLGVLSWLGFWTRSLSPERREDDGA